MRKKTKRRKVVSKKAKPRIGRRRNNGRVLIGASAEKLTYRGGKGKPATSRWVHEFETPVKVWGLEDGSVLLEAVDQSLRLWDNYDVEVK